MSKKAKKVLLRLLLGFILGTFISTLVLIAISYTHNTGRFLVAEEHFIEKIGSELGAFTLQFLLTGIMGVGFAAGSLIFEAERWSITKQTALHFLVTAGTLLPVAYICGWMYPSLTGFLTYAGIFAGIYVVIWGVQFIAIRKSVAAVNGKLKTDKKK